MKVLWIGIPILYTIESGMNVLSIWCSHRVFLICYNRSIRKRSINRCFFPCIKQIDKTKIVYESTMNRNSNLVYYRKWNECFVYLLYTWKGIRKRSINRCFFPCIKQIDKTFIPLSIVYKIGIPIHSTFIYYFVYSYYSRLERLGENTNAGISKDWLKADSIWMLRFMISLHRRLSIQIESAFSQSLLIPALVFSPSLSNPWMSWSNCIQPRNPGFFLVGARM
jgi:hypothetical protein